MIEAKIEHKDDGTFIGITVNGNSKEIFVETAYFLRNLYESLKRKEPAVAEDFREYMADITSSKLFWVLPQGHTHGMMVDLSGAGRGGAT